MEVPNYRRPARQRCIPWLARAFWTLFLGGSAQVCLLLTTGQIHLYENFHHR